jgi:pimeloyl-ACP methyl ester carboxylesterase
VTNALAALPSDAHREAAIAYYRNMFRFTPAPPAYAELHGYRFTLPCRPILHLHGDQDGAMQVAYTENLLAALPAGGRIQIVRGAGHFAQVDQPEAVATAILDYLAS